MPLVLGVIFIAAAIYVLPDYFGGGEEIPEEGVEEVLVIDSAPSQRDELDAIVFPLLPDGIYSGTITGIVPGQAVPLTLISTSKHDSLTVIVGIAGWTPTT